MSRVSELELCNLAYGGHDAVLKLRIAGMFKKKIKIRLIKTRNQETFVLCGRHG